MDARCSPKRIIADHCVDKVESLWKPMAALDIT